MIAFPRLAAAATAIIVVGTGVTLTALEKVMIDHHAGATVRATTQVAPELLLFFAGFIVANVGVFYLLSWWNTFYRSNPGLRRVRVSVLIAIMAVLGSGIVFTLARHANHMASLPAGTARVSWGYIGLMVALTTMLLLTLVFIAVRWSPGFHRRLGQLPPQTTTTERTS